MAAKKVLRTHVHVTKADGSVVVFEAGASVPGWAHKVIDDIAFVEVETPATDSEQKSEEPPAGSDDDAALKVELEGLGLSSEGTHEELVERLADHKE